jgi:hypothetical protein
MPVVSKKQGKFMQAVANSPKFAKKVGVKQSIGREFTKEKDMKKAVKKMNMGGMADREGRAMAAGRLAGRPGMMADARGRAMMKKGGKVKKMREGGNTSKMNELEELGRVDAEKGYSAKGKRNLKDEKARVVREIKNKKAATGIGRAGGKVGYAAGGKVSMTSMKDREGRALAKDKKGMTAAQMRDARGRAMQKEAMMASAKPLAKSTMKGAMAGAKAGGLGMKKGGATMKAKGKKMMGGGKVKAYKKGGAVSSASKRADGIAQRGHTRGRHV